MNRLHFDSTDMTKAFRPIFVAHINGKLTPCLLDTGATLPVFKGDSALLNAWFLNTTNITVEGKVNIRGFGGNRSSAVLHNFERFTVSDGTNEMHFRNMKIAVQENNVMAAQLIIPSSMLAFCRYCIDTTKIPSQIYIEPKFDNMYIKLSSKNLGIEVYTHAV